ncbi:hypothetical protein CLOM_g16762 [Closterium sp. NIES-68]|nr:hypothetical protein CLOM_g16762 [Closterium sp. NIES-68]
MAGNIRLQRRLQRKAQARRQQLSYRTIRSAFLVAVLCSATYAWVIFLKGSRPYWWWGPSTGDHPDLIKARFASRPPEPANLWDNPVKGKWKQCVRPSPTYADGPLYESTGFLQVFLDGGLNQQRISICNAVAVARLLNATLLIPHFQINPVWLDNSQFEDIFDIEHFMHYLRHDVLIVRQLPQQYKWSTRDFYSTGVHQNRIKFAPMHASPAWYLKNVLPKLQRHGVVAIAPFTHRLAFDGLPPDIQRLRCRVNFHALRFVEPVRRLGKILVERLRDPNRRHVRRGVLFGKGGDVSSYGAKGKGGGIGEVAGEPEKGGEAKEVGSGGVDTGEGGERKGGQSEGKEESELQGEGGEGKGGEKNVDGSGGVGAADAEGRVLEEDGKGSSAISAGAAGGSGDAGADGGGGGAAGAAAADGGAAAATDGGGGVTTAGDGRDDADAEQQASKGRVETVEEDEGREAQSEDEGEDEGARESEGRGGDARRRLMGISSSLGALGKEGRGGEGGGGGGRRGGGEGEGVVAAGNLGEEDSEEGSEGAFWSEDGAIDEEAKERVRMALQAGRAGRAGVAEGKTAGVVGEARARVAGNPSGGNGIGGLRGAVDGLSQIEESGEGEIVGGEDGSSVGGSRSSKENERVSQSGSGGMLSGRKEGRWAHKERRRKRFVAMHLRFDMDMVAHSACDYGETWAEREALSRYREYAWLGRVDKLRFSSDELRLAGKCPLTPEEVGLVLAALGFSSRTRLYVATYQVYGGEKRIAPLRRLFPWLEDKTSLATEEELRPFLGKASLLAALDFYVSRYSDVFVSASLGNMHNVMAAHRAYFGGLKTINFNGTLLATLLAAPRGALKWNDFVRAVRIGHRSRMGKIKLRRPGQSIYTYPAPDCLCPVGLPPPTVVGTTMGVSDPGMGIRDRHVGGIDETQNGDGVNRVNMVQRR